MNPKIRQKPPIPAKLQSNLFKRPSLPDHLEKNPKKIDINKFYKDIYNDSNDESNSVDSAENPMKYQIQALNSMNQI